jgi:lipopolysaccharide heptosyltransferase II
MVPVSRLREIDARRVCVVKPSAFGDIVQALPLLPVLRERFPGSHLAWVVNHSLRDLLTGLPALDEVISFHRGGPWRSAMALLRTLRSQRFDLVFDLQGLLRTGLMVAATGAPLRVGLESAREGANLACNCVIPDSGRMVPAHLRYWRIAEALGMEDRQRVTQVHIGKDERLWADRHLAILRRPNEPGAPLLAIHPGARWTTKRWPLEKFAVVGAKAIRKFGFSVVVLGSPDEQEVAAQLEMLLRRFAPAGNILNLTGNTTLKQLAAVLQAADVCLTNDSGPMHLAAGLGTSVVGIFTCTNAVRSGPPGENHELIETELSCAGSYRKKCPYRGKHHMACMEELAAERVWSAFVRLVERKRRERKAA